MLNQLFAYDGIVSKFLQKFWKCFALNLFFLLGCIPVLTIGTSFTAMYYAMQKNVADERGHLTTAFWDGFKGNLKQSILTQLVFLAVGLLFAEDVYFFYHQMKAGNSLGMLWILFALLFVLVVLTAIYTYCYMARIENTFKNTIKDSFLIMFLCPAQNLKIVLYLVAGGLLIYIFPFALFFVPAFICFFIRGGMEKTLEKYMIKPEEERENEAEESEAEESKTKSTDGSADEIGAIKEDK